MDVLEQYKYLLLGMCCWEQVVALGEEVAALQEHSKSRRHCQHLEEHYET